MAYHTVPRSKRKGMNRKSSRRRGSVLCAALVGLVMGAEQPDPAEARVESTALRQHPSSRLLFWSTYDLSVDAASLFLSPFDDMANFGWAEDASGFDDPKIDENTELPSNVLEELLSEVVPQFDVNGVLDYFRNVIEDLVHLRGGSDGSSSSVLSPPNPVTLPDDSSSLSEGDVSGNSTLLDSATGLVQEEFVFSIYNASDPDGLPDRYMRMQNHDRGLAKKAFESTLEWRSEHDIDHLLQRPHPKYDIAKAVFPHYFLGRDGEGHVLFIQRPAQIDLDIAHANGLTTEDLLMHYVYCNEYLWQVLEADDPFGQMTSVLDLTGLKLGFLRKTELVGFLKRFVSTMDSHYPQRAHKTLIVNCPKWFNTLYKLISPLLRESTKAKIELHSRGKQQDEALRHVLGEGGSTDLLPSVLWSDSKLKDDDPDDRHVESELELALRAFCLARLTDAGQDMLPVEQPAS